MKPIFKAATAEQIANRPIPKILSFVDCGVYLREIDLTFIIPNIPEGPYTLVPSIEFEEEFNKFKYER